MRKQIVLAAMLLAGVLPAQQASYTFFGAGCVPYSGTGPAPTLTVQGLPRLGQSFTVIYTGPNLTPATGGPSTVQAQPILLTGVSNSSTQGVALPWRIPDIPSPYPGAVSPLHGCILRVSPDIFLPMPPIVGTMMYRDRMALSVPNDLALLGVVFYQQWLTLEIGCAAYQGCETWVYSSPGGHAVIGM